MWKSIKILCTITLLVATSYYLYRYAVIRRNHGVPPAGYYYVTYVFDGDTVEVDMNGTAEKVRMIGVDTPETHKPNTPVQCYGMLASEYTKSRVEHKNVRLESDAINQDRDRYGRLLRYVYLEDGTLWNLSLIQLGYGHALTAFPFTKVTEFQNAETSARENSHGLWSSCQ